MSEIIGTTDVNHFYSFPLVYLRAMKRLLAIVLAYLMVFQTFNKLTIVVYYQINKKVITELFCINKDKPQLKCDGKCFLAKKLKEADRQTEKQDPFLLSSGFELLFDVPDTFYLMTNCVFDIENSIPPYLTGIYEVDTDSVFHPPKT